MSELETAEIFRRLAVALGAGLLVGIERGWSARTQPEGTRVAGIRTFGLIGLLGGLWGLVSEVLGPVPLGIAFAAFAVVLIVAHTEAITLRSDVGITTVVAGLVTFALGALSVLGWPGVAAAGAVVTSLLLSLKPLLHRWVAQLEPDELNAALRLLLISVVLLPVLPNRGFGPWQALNPYEIWTLVVLIAAISFAAYFAMKVAGVRLGSLATALLGGLVSSTAVTLGLSRLARERAADPGILAAGVVASSAMMFARVTVLVAVANPALLPDVAPWMAAASTGGFALAAWLWRRAPGDAAAARPRVANPLELGAALQFGALLAAVMLLAQAVRASFGPRGLYGLAAAAGLTDVDAITLSLARMAMADLGEPVATRAIVLASLVNTAVKAGLAGVVGGREMARRSLPAFGAMLALAGTALVVLR